MVSVEKTTLSILISVFIVFELFSSANPKITSCFITFDDTAGSKEKSNSIVP